MNPVQQISNKLNTYSEQFPSVLEDYKKSYIIHNKYMHQIKEHYIH